MVNILYTCPLTPAYNWNLLGMGGHVKALTPRERYFCPETADMFQLVSASNLEKNYCA